MTAPGKIDRKDARLSLVHIGIGYFAVFLGTLCGVLQGLVRSGGFELPPWLNYYQILTAHGVLLALVFTTYFIYGFFFSGMSRTMGTLSNAVRRFSWLGFSVMTLGTILATIMIVMNEASVMYTFYVPLKAHPLFYIGLALFIVGTWISGFALLAHYFGWKKKHKGEITPLFGFMTTITIIMWIIACLGVVSTVLFQIIPWSLGWVDTINVELSRSLFWYFGHPLVYFWLLPAYMAWYVIVPKIIGGKVFSDSLARLSFILFLLFSIPVGFHHQLVEPGISTFWKFLQTCLTFMVVFPSLMTAFSMFATFELAGRAKGATGLFGWFKKLPFHDVRFLALFLAMLFFIPGGAGGLVNASFQMDEVVHNTLWIVGHFHITVGTPVVMTFFGITYWLIPYLTNRKLTAGMNKFGKIQIIVWAVGMFFMSTSQHILGLFGAPRRTAFTTYGDHPDALRWFEGLLVNQVTMAVGGVLLFISAMMMIGAVIYLWAGAPQSDEEEFPIAETAEDALQTPKIFENWWIWIGTAFVLIAIAYTIPLWEIIQMAPPGSQPFRTW
ncbi:b(o/a)3-type cytochrome-c oxidase subunit 1 [Bacillus taeanensis]|uniref:Cytochrome C n=1 Tax=Bacillus taeanensis TaxID=273032 RepID=A0A366XVK4_9BACI|nr:b(o/a)3-type cytochrome-c oxidase subunit 1 [Bacillus taeanensis]RBW68164.1 cytochrome C [Bacillus taeanensis]